MLRAGAPPPCSPPRLSGFPRLVGSVPRAHGPPSSEGQTGGPLGGRSHPLLLHHVGGPPEPPGPPDPAGTSAPAGGHGSPAAAPTRVQGPDLQRAAERGSRWGGASLRRRHGQQVDHVGEGFLQGGGAMAVSGARQVRSRREPVGGRGRSQARLHLIKLWVGPVTGRGLRGRPGRLPALGQTRKCACCVKRRPGVLLHLQLFLP